MVVLHNLFKGTTRFTGYAFALGTKIALKEEDLVNEDRVVGMELKRRSAAAQVSPPPFGIPNNSSQGNPLLPSLWPIAIALLYNNSVDESEDGRRYVPDTRRDYVQRPNNSLVENITVKMMEQACYAAQYRMKDVTNILQKYANSTTFRIAYAFKQLDVWEREVLELFTYFYTHSNNMYTFPLLHQMWYYAHAQRRMIDVTYTRAFILELHALHQKEIKDEADALAKSMRTTSTSTKRRRRTRKRDVDSSIELP